jgi:small subunit ribosomal protein S11
MGQKRITTQQDGTAKNAEKAAPVKSSKKSVDGLVLHVQSTYNNTKLTLTDSRGNALLSASSGSTGFSGAKKGTPFAAAKVGEVLGEKAVQYGIKDLGVIVKGVGSGRESAIRGFISKGFNISYIKDVTPVPFNGPKPKKPRRV